MGLIEQAKEDIEEITSDLEGFGVEMVLTAPTGEVLPITGLHTKHHLAIDQETMKQVNSKNAHISVSEQFLIDAGYPYRNADNEVYLQGHLVTVNDSTGNSCVYVIREWFPDRTIGLIVCILGDYSE